MAGREKSQLSFSGVIPGVSTTLQYRLHAAQTRRDELCRKKNKKTQKLGGQEGEGGEDWSGRSWDVR